MGSPSAAGSLVSPSVSPPAASWISYFLCMSRSEAKVVMQKAIMLDGTTVSAAFDDTADMGIVGTVAGTLWCINWLDDSSIRLVSGHMTRVPD